MNGRVFSEEELLDLITQRIEGDRVPKKIRILHETSNLLNMEYNDVLLLGERPYFLRHTEKEGRFGIDEQPKYWVRRAIDLLDGKYKILKMVFHESYETRIGQIVFQCVRSPRKEARILKLVKGHRNFMQGYSVRDEKGNLIRILDFITGRTLSDYVKEISVDHEKYFFTCLPMLLDHFIELAAAIDFLHQNTEKHGDIRRDHIILDKVTGNYCWIDFDYNYLHGENIAGYDLFGLGNVLIYITGGRDLERRELQTADKTYGGNIDHRDFNIVFGNRLANLKKIFPYIPEELNNILLHFSIGSKLFYENVGELIDELREARKLIVQKGSV